MRTLILLLVLSCTREVSFRRDLKTDQSQKMCFIGDMGNGSETQRKVAEDLKAESCDQVFVVGDVVYSKGIESVEDPLLDERFGKFYEPVATTGKKPLFSVVLGNHDFAGNEEAWKDVPKKYPWVFYPHSYHLQKINGACFVAMESDYYTGAFELEALRQMLWLEGIQEELKGCDLRVLFAHHPYVSAPGRRPAKGWLKRVYEESVVGKYDIVVTGHDHILADLGKRSGTHFLISGAGGQSDGGRAGFLVLELDYREGKLREPRTRFHLVE